MFPGIVLDKRFVAVQQSAGGVMKWESPLNNAGYGVNQDKTKGQHEVVETRGLRNKLVQLRLASCTTAPTINLEGSADGVNWVQLDTGTATDHIELTSVDDYPLTRVNIPTYTDGDIDGEFYARE